MSKDKIENMRTNILEYIKNKKPIFQQKYHIQKIGLFGSYAKENEHFGSDIDLILKFEDSYIESCDPWEYFIILNYLKEEISKKFMLHVDIVDEQSDSPYLEIIKKEAIYA